MVKKLTDFSHIKGWAHDADPNNDPTWPMRTRYENDNQGMNWMRPAMQQTKVEILHSTERPDLTAVFGDVLPPSGISGHVRRFAFRFSESNWLHWLGLILADRIQMLECDAAEVLQGRIPNIFAERGMRAELRHNPAGLASKLLIASAIAYLGYKLCRKSKY